MSKEPSMEEILSSIKRIIAEEGDEASRGITARAPRRGRPSEAPEIVGEDSESADGIAEQAAADEVLELTDPLDLEEAPAAPPAPPAAAPSASKFQPAFSPASEAHIMAQTAKKPAPAPAPAAPAPEPVTAEAATPATMLSVESEVAARHSLSALSAMVVKPQAGDDNTLESLVRELLRPMMKDWLDANLPDLVETMVAREIARITGREL